jgi:hypothetical protein
MRKDRVFRLRMPTAEVAALKRVAKDKGEAASAYVRRLVAEQVRRDDAARSVREMLRAARKGRLTDAQAMRLADEAKHATRPK